MFFKVEYIDLNVDVLHIFDGNIELDWIFDLKFLWISRKQPNFLLVSHALQLLGAVIILTIYDTFTFVKPHLGQQLPEISLL